LDLKSSNNQVKWVDGKARDGSASGTCEGMSKGWESWANAWRRRFPILMVEVEGIKLAVVNIRHLAELIRNWFEFL
jgi:hypothetical protein